jgi:hypothetical protein
MGTPSGPPIKPPGRDGPITPAIKKAPAKPAPNMKGRDKSKLAPRAEPERSEKEMRDYRKSQGYTDDRPRGSDL